MIEPLKLIIKNKEHIISKKGLFDKDTINMLNALIKGELPKDFNPTKEQQELLISVYLLSNNTFNENTPNFILENKECILHSIKNDVNSINFTKISKIEDIDIFKQLISCHYDFHEKNLKNIPLSYLNDPELLEYYLKKFNIIDPKKDNEIYISRIKNIIHDIINSYPTISNFNEYFEIRANYQWNKRYHEYRHLYENIFGKICSYLQSVSSLETIEEDLDFIYLMKETLEIKYNTLYRAIEEYHQIYHQNNPDKLEKIQKSKDTIASLSALYTAKSKENFKKEIIIKEQDNLKPYYELRKDHPLVLKKTIEIKQREKFRNIFYTYGQTKEFKEYINQIKTKYHIQISEQLLNQMLEKFIYDGITDISDFIKKPSRYDQYLTYQKVSKLINRLNSKYIKITDYEVSKYRELIKYDETNKKYIYDGLDFDKETINEIKTYQNYQKIYNNIIKEIMKTIKTLEVTDEISNKTYRQIKRTIPFTDEYFIFKRDLVLNEIKFKNLLDCGFSEKYNPDSITKDKSYNLIHKTLIDNNLMWLLLFLEHNCYFNRYEYIYNGINSSITFKIINYMSQIISLADTLKIDICNFTNLSKVYNISEYANEQQMAILGPEIISKLSIDRNYTNEIGEEIINVATDLICAMTKRKNSTIPYISGETLNYKYSIYDPLDETILLSGINTDSCFRCCGNDNDFLHYCALNKNGFVIKITDHLGNFIGKASGFRHGNIIYINQLRTIYDKGGNSYNERYEHETKSIIEVFKKACLDIIETSLNNEFEEDKIEHIFVTRSYSLSRYNPTIPYVVEETLANFLIDNESEDWENYLQNTYNIEETIEDDYFVTDFTSYPLICIATSIKGRELEASDIILKDVKAVYKRKRNEILVTENITKEIHQKINKITAIASYFDNTEFINIDIPLNSLVCLGDNWFIIYNNGNIINSCCLDFDEKAKIEFNTTIEIIKNNAKKIKEELHINEQIKTKDIYRKILKRI